MEPNINNKEKQVEVRRVNSVDGMKSTPQISASKGSKNKIHPSTIAIMVLLVIIACMVFYVINVVWFDTKDTDMRGLATTTGATGALEDGNVSNDQVRIDEFKESVLGTSSARLVASPYIWNDASRACKVTLDIPSVQGLDSVDIENRVNTNLKSVVDDIQTLSQLTDSETNKPISPEQFKLKMFTQRTDSLSKSFNCDYYKTFEFEQNSLISNRIVSVFMGAVPFSGGVHPTKIFRSILIDLKTGEKITPLSLLDYSAHKKEIDTIFYDAIKDSFKKEGAESDVFGDYSSLSDMSIILTHDGFSVSQIYGEGTPFALGDFEVTIPLEKLAPYLVNPQ